MALLALALGVFIALPFAIGLTLRPRHAWSAWITLAVVIAVSQALSGEVQAFTISVVLLAMSGGFFLQFGLHQRRKRTIRN